MIGILITASLCYLTYLLGKPIQIAAAAAAISFIVSLLLGASFLGSLVYSAVHGAFCLALFWLVDRVRHDVVKVVSVSVAGCVIQLVF